MTNRRARTQVEWLVWCGLATVGDVGGDGQARAPDRWFGPAIGSLGERRMHLINGATGQRIQSFQSPVNGEEFGASIAAILDRTGKLRTITSGTGTAAAPGAPSRAGRGYAFPLSLAFLSGSMPAEGLRVALTATDDELYEIQTSPDMNIWTPLTNLQATAQPVSFVDETAKGTNHRFYRARHTDGSP